MNNQAINEDFADLIIEKGKNGKLDLSDYNLSWTWFGDNAENCGTSSVESISIGEDINGVTIIWVEFDDRDETLDNLHYEDVLGNNFAEWLYYVLI